MKKIALLFIIIFTVVISSFAMQNKKNKPSINFENYEKSWSKIQEFENNGQPKSALAEVEIIILQSKKEQNSPQLVKGLLHKFKYQMVLEEDSELKIVNSIREEILNTDNAIAKSILQSIMAESLWQYYENNRYKFLDRTQTSSNDEKDFRTWDLSMILKEIRKNYFESVKESSKLQLAKVADYDIILLKQEESATYRPTLYDLLAHRAIDFFANSESGLAEPTISFDLNNADYFKVAQSFILINLPENTTSLDKDALEIFQDLLAFRLKDNNVKALVDADLKRFNFLLQNSTLDNKNELYLTGLQQLAKTYKADNIVAYINYNIAQFWYNNSQNETPEKDLRVNAVQLCKETIAAYPNAFGTNNCISLLASIQSKSIAAEMEGIIVPDEAFKSLIRYKNINQAFFKIVQLTADEVGQYIDYNDRNTWISKLLDRKAVHEWAAELIDPADYYDHSTELKMDGLPIGIYVLLVSTDKEFKNDVNVIKELWSSNISYVVRNETSETLEAYFFNRKNGSSLVGAVVDVFYDQYDYTTRKNIAAKLGTYTTNEDGFIKISNNATNGNNIYFDVKYKNDQLNDIQKHYLYPNYQGQENEYTTTYFFTDRAIYRPGQTIYFKGIQIRSLGVKHEVVANVNTYATFLDANYQEITNLNFTTNEYGSFQGSFTAPSGGLMGNMTIAGEGGQINIQIEEYKRPTFEVLLDTLTGSYSLNQEVNLTGKAISYAGAPLIESSVNYRVVRQVRYPYWYWGWKRMPYSSEAKEIAHGETETNNEGSYSIQFNTIPDLSVPKKDQPQFQYTVYVDVVDINGETRSSEKTITASYVGLNLSVQAPENWDRDKNQNITVSTTNMDGKEEAAEVNIKLYKLTPPQQLKKDRLWQIPDQWVMSQKEHDQWFPNDVYSDEKNIETWEKVLIKEYKVNTGNTKSIEVSSEVIKSSGVYGLESETRDNAGNLIEAKTNFVAVSSKDKKLPKPSQLSVSTDRTSYEPGDKAILSIGTSLKNARIVYLLCFDGKVIDRQYFQLTDEIKRIEIPIESKNRGGLQVQCLLVNENRVYNQSSSIEIPFESTDLQVEWITFRDLLEPGQKEQWKLKIKGPKGDKVASELLAGMYDKSLDYFMPHDFSFPIQLNPGISYAHGFDIGRLFSSQATEAWINTIVQGYNSYNVPQYDNLNFFGFYLAEYQNQVSFFGGKGGGRGTENQRFDAVAESIAMDGESDEKSVTAVQAPKAFPNDGQPTSNGDVIENPASQIPKSETKFSPRTNLNETAFFFPQLETNAEGEILIDFTMPEALTTWKFIGFAHDKLLQNQIFTKEVKTQKELMVTPNVPRFFREGDEIIITSKIDNLSDKQLKGNATLLLKDALTNEVINPLLLTSYHQVGFDIDEKGSTVVKWKLKISEDVQAVTYEIMASAGNYTDGVTSTIPVLTNRMMVTETMPIWLKGKGSRTFSFKSLKENQSQTLKNYQLTLEYASNPAWYAVQALPYLMEFPHECTEQLFSRYYANSLAEHIANSNPRIQEIFNQWKMTGSDALISNLEKNQELKSLLIEETPWLRDAQDETERKKRIALLFDLNRMTNEKATLLKKLQDRQTSNGGFTWFPGMPDNRYITQHILSSVAHLVQLDVKGAIEDPIIQGIIERAIPYLDDRIAEDLIEIKKYDKNWKKENHLSSIQIHYLYMRSHFKSIPIKSNAEEAFNYFLAQAEKYGLGMGLYDEGMIAIALHGYDKNEMAKKIMVSIKENSIISDEKGMYWKALEQRGCYWYNAPIETQALLIEAFHTVMNDQMSVNEMKVWLLKQKQVQDWKTTKATTEAIFALLLRGNEWLSNTKPVEIKVAGTVIDPKERNASYEAGTGYFKVKWEGKEVKKEMAEVKLTSETDAPSWGAVYWQYFEDLDQIKGFQDTPLQLKKTVYLETNTNSGPVIAPISESTPLKPGDKIKIRIELRVDRNMEFVHMKDMRASGLEPINVLSQYKYQDGLGYYESTKDAATHFFFDYLPKGVYVFEYPLRVAQEGEFSNGVATIQSMYAPEFSSHSEGIRIQVK